MHRQRIARRRKVITRLFHFCKDCLNGRWGYPALSTSLKDKRYNEPHHCAYCGKGRDNGFKAGKTRKVQVEYKGKGNFDHWYRIINRYIPQED